MSIKEKFIKAKEKVVNFVEDHPNITAALVFMGCITGAAVISAVRSENYNGTLDGISNDDVNDWKQYEENWNKVNAFAETLNLLPGESFIIEDAEQYRDCTDLVNCDFSKPIVSHLVYNEGIYPPEE